MAGTRVTVLGASNTGFSIAANLALAGHDVLLWEHPAYTSTLDPIRDTRAIHLEGTARTGQATLAAVTTETDEALAWSDVLLCSVPSYAHVAFAEQLVPRLRDGHILALLPGNLGALAFAKSLQQVGQSAVTLVESDTAPYVCR